MSEENFEIIDRLDCTIGLRLTKDDEFERKYSPDFKEDNIQIYISDRYVGLTVNVTLEEAVMIRNELDSLIKTLTE